MDEGVLRRNLLFGLLLVALVIVFEILLAGLGLPAWPAFLVMIQFFVVHEDVSRAPEIIVGGLFGIACSILAGTFGIFVGPILGEGAARLTFIGLFVYSIVVLKDVLPYVFNSHAFLFFLVSSIAKGVGPARPYVWMLVELVVGVVFVAGILGIARVVDAAFGGGRGAPGEKA
jgi:hypothetical protein